jgi:hypothetical protein
MAKVNLITRIEPELKEAFKALAASKRPPVTVSAYVEYLIKEELERQSTKDTSDTQRHNNNSDPNP